MQLMSPRKAVGTLYAATIASHSEWEAAEEGLLVHGVVALLVGLFAKVPRGHLQTHRACIEQSLRSIQQPVRVLVGFNTENGQRQKLGLVPGLGKRSVMIDSSCIRKRPRGFRIASSQQRYFQPNRSCRHKTKI